MIRSTYSQFSVVVSNYQKDPIVSSSSPTERFWMTAGKTLLYQGEESRNRWREREKKIQAAAMQQPFASATAQSVTAQPEKQHSTPLPLSLSGKSCSAAGVA